MCNTDDWNIIKGTWDYDSSDCSVDNTNSGDGNIIWFGSQDGLTPNNDYVFDSFSLEVEIQRNSATGSSTGIIIRAQSVSTTNDGGQQYYIGLRSSSVIFGRMNDGWTDIQYQSYAVQVGAIHTLKVDAIGTIYNVWVDNTQILSDVELSEYMNGSIGVRTYYSPAKFYSVVFRGLFLLFCKASELSAL